MFFKILICAILIHDIVGVPTGLSHEHNEGKIRQVRSPHLKKKLHQLLHGSNDGYYPPQQQGYPQNTNINVNYNVNGGGGGYGGGFHHPEPIHHGGGESFASSSAYAGSSGHGGYQSQAQSQSGAFALGPIAASFSQSQAQSH